MTTLFDPNYGEFTVRSDQMGEVFKSLAERYRNPNQRDISTVVTQRVAWAFGAFTNSAEISVFPGAETMETWESGRRD
jgi:hypothetical protein